MGEEFRFEGAVGRMTHRIANELSNGDVAALRRASSGVFSGAFWRLLLEEIPEDRRRTPADESRWGTAIGLLALCRGLHNPKTRAGAALAEGGWSETRLVRLLEARDEQLDAGLRQVGHYLTSKQLNANLADLAKLAIYQSGDHAERVRLDIARAYYKAENEASKH